jgi:uncharacterized protein (TIGR02271 family)
MAKLPKHRGASTPTSSSAEPKPVELRIPLMKEEIEVGKRRVDTGKGVRVHKTVSEHEQLVDLSLLHDEITIEHVPMDWIITEAEPPGMRQEGDTMIVPVFEEILVVQKQLRLKEEIRITRHQRERHAPPKVRLKTETATVERFNETPSAGHTISREGE